MILSESSVIGQNTRMRLHAVLMCLFLLSSQACAINAFCFCSGSGDESPPSVPIAVTLSLSPVPLVNEVGELRCLVTCALKASNVTVKVKLPDGLALVSGDLSWEGNLPANGKIELKASIKSLNVGDWTIEADARYSFPGGIYMDENKLHITITEASAYINKQPLTTKTPVAVQLTTQTVTKTAATTIRHETKPKPP